jgi:hypothetical protein
LTRWHLAAIYEFEVFLKSQIPGTARLTKKLDPVEQEGLCPWFDVCYASVGNGLGLDPVLAILRILAGLQVGKVKVPWQFLLRGQILVKFTTGKIPKSHTLAGGTQEIYFFNTRLLKLSFTTETNILGVIAQKL